MKYLSRASVLASVLAAFAALGGACEATPSTPPVEGNTPYDAGSGGNHSGGGGGGGTATECAEQGGQCLQPGDACEGGASCSSCPSMIIGSTVCGPNTVSEAGVVNLICCTGFDDAGAPTGEL